MRLIPFLVLLIVTTHGLAQDRDSLLQSGYAHLSEMQYKAAKGPFQTLVNLNKRDIEARLGIGICHFHLKDLDAAEHHFDHMAFRAPNDGRAHYWIARIAFERKQYTAAHSGFKTALRYDSLLTGVAYYAGASAYQLGLDSAANAFLAEALKESEALDYTNYYMGLLAMQEGQLDGAEAFIHSAVVLNPHIPRFHVGLGDVAFEKRDYFGAFAHYKDATVRNPNYGEAWYRQTEALLQMDMANRALVAHNKAATLMGSTADVKWQHIRIQYAMGNYAEAKTEILAHHREIGRQDETDVVMARIYSKLDDHHTSYLLYQSVRKAYPERVDLAREFAAEAFVLEKWSIAKTLYAWCAERSGDDVFDRYNLAIVQVKLGDKVAACEGFQFVVDNGSDTWGEQALLAMEQHCN